MSNHNQHAQRVHTPRFGACFHAKDPVRRCALTPSDCHDEHEVYISAYVLSHAAGQTPCFAQDVTVGRCVSQNTCAPSEDACYRGDFYVSAHDLSSFKSYDKTCTMVREDFKKDADVVVKSGPLKATTYPECVDPQGNTQRCVIDGSFCHSDEVLHEQTPNCRCQDVATGVCYPKDLAVHDITSSNSFCAIHAEDCGSATDNGHTQHLFLNATSLPPGQMDCRLCDPSNSHPGSFPAGACQQTRGSNAKHSLRTCALESKDCEDSLNNLEFLSAHTILEEYGLYCPANHAENNLGHCIAEIADYKPHQAPKHACLQKKYCRTDKGFTFLPQADCTLSGKSGENNNEAVNKNVPAYFGKCVASQQSAAVPQPRCVWDPTHCQELDGFQPPPSSFDEEWDCTCDKVSTGACRLPGDSEVYQCAVSPYGCQDHSAFVPQAMLPLHVKEKCRLCPPPPTTMAPSTLAPSTLAPTTRRTKAPTIDLNLDYNTAGSAQDLVLVEDPEGVGSVTGIYWAITLVVVAGVVLLTLLTLWFSKKNQRQSAAKEAAVQQFNPPQMDPHEEYAVRVPEMT